MGSFIGQVHLSTDNVNDYHLIGSTLYGVCGTPIGTAAKTVLNNSTDDNSGKFINAHYDRLVQGTTIHVKFVSGNSVDTGVTLQVGGTAAKTVVGKCVCDPGTIISFTLDENEYWVVNDNVDTNTEYEFMTAYNATTNKAATAADLTALNIQAAAHKGVSTSIGSTSTNDELATAASVYSYVQQQTGGLAGITGAMHFRGIVTAQGVTITDGGTEDPSISTYTFKDSNNNIIAIAGDVILFGTKEFVWTADGSNGHWEELGDEGSYALNSSVDVVSEVTGWSANTPTGATVSQGLLTISIGTAASLTPNDVTVVVPPTQASSGT